MGHGEPYAVTMATPPDSGSTARRDRWIALAASAVAALVAAGWLTRERQLATDLAESREEVRQAMHRLQTTTASTDQIRAAYLQRRAEWDAARKKIEQLAQRQEEKKREASAGAEKKKERAESKSPPPDTSGLWAALNALKLPSWTALQKTEGMIRLLPGAAAPQGNEGYAAFGGLARTLADADADMEMELRARAEPGPDALETAQDRAKRLAVAAERSLKGGASRVRVVAEVAKGPRMEWRLTPATPPPAKTQPAQP